MYILGLNFNHDGSAAIVKNGKILAAISSERITRRKKNRGVPPAVVDYLLAASSTRIEDIDVFAVCNWQGDTADSVSLYNKETDGWQAFTENDVPLTNDIYRSLIQYSHEAWGCYMSYRGIKKPVVFLNHHLAHAAYSYYMSPYTDAISVAVDVADEFGNTNGIVDFTDGGKCYRFLKHDHSLRIGGLYSSLCDCLGFWPSVVGAGKVMALAAFGTPSPEYKQFMDTPVFNPVDDILSAYGAPLPLYHTYYPQLENEGGTPDKNWLKKDDFASPLSTSIAATAQALLEDTLLDYFKKIKQRTQRRNLCLSGGTLLNCVAVGKLVKEAIFENVFIAPACGDDGLSIGAAMLVSNCFCMKVNQIQRLPTFKNILSVREVFEGGKCYSSLDIDIALEKYRAMIESRHIKSAFVEEDEKLVDIVSGFLAEGLIVGWFYRGSELGPRALGHRSILADPRRSDMKDVLNAKVKHRESFRPFAPSVLKEHANEWFDTTQDSPFMLVSMLCKKPDVIPAICHVDNSSRIQTVDVENNGRYYDLIKSFYDKTGVPCVVNTSFNIQGEPIVETPSDAIKCFLGTHIDVLVLEHLILVK